MVGLLTYLITGEDCELTSLDRLAGGKGLGTALVERLTTLARGAGCRSGYIKGGRSWTGLLGLWLIF